MLGLNSADGWFLLGYGREECISQPLLAAVLTFVLAVGLFVQGLIATESARATVLEEVIITQR
jgi:hypothetical protein